MAVGCREVILARLWLLQAVLNGVVGQGMVSWQMGTFGVAEDEGRVEACATYSEAVEGFSVETVTTDFTATNGTDYLSQTGTAAQLIWGPNTTTACVSFPIINDAIVENDEVFFLNMLRIVTTPSSATPSLDRQAIILIMDDDDIEVIFSTEGIVATDDVGSVEVCVEVSNEQVDEGVQFRIPIAVETVDGTAEPNTDFAPFNNMTVGEASRAVLTHISPSHCFSITILARPDDRLDDRSFFVNVLLRVMAKNIEPNIERIALPTSDFEVTIQPSAQIEVGDIRDSVLSSPVFSVSVDMKGEEEDSNLCYEVSGERGVYLNLVSDVCFSINARYEAIEEVSGYNKIEEVAITTSDAADGCSHILISAKDDCASATVYRNGQPQMVNRRYRRNGVQIDFGGNYIEVLLPCTRYPGGGIKMITRCRSEYESPFDFEILQIKNLELVFNRGKLPVSTQPLPHGLLGQFWHLDFTKQPFTGAFQNRQPRDDTVQVTTPQELGTRSFVSLDYPVTWDQRSENCLYAGSRQAGASNYATSPADSVIEGDYTNYKVERSFDSEYKYSVFSSSDFNCPTMETAV